MTRWTINELLQERHRGFSPLQKLLHQAGNQAVWTAAFQAIAPPDIARDCRVMDVKGSLLVISCTNAGTATRLRFMTPDLVAACRQLADFRAVESLRIRVTPN